MRIASAVVCTISTLTILAACSGDEVTVGKNDQALTTKKYGTPTGDGTTCSWAGNDATNGTSSSYSLGQDFGSLDGCNDCTCTADGIMCTIRTCRGSADGGSGSADAGPHACLPGARDLLQARHEAGTARGRVWPQHVMRSGRHRLLDRGEALPRWQDLRGPHRRGLRVRALPVTREQASVRRLA